MTISTESQPRTVKRKLLPALGKGAAVLAAATLGFGLASTPASAAPAAPAYPDCGATFDHGYLGGPPDIDDNFGVRIEYHNVGAWIGSQVGDAVVTSAAGRSKVYSVDPNGTYFVANFNLGETGTATLALFRGDGPHVCSTSFAIGVVG
ncbi:hypothetical protein [Amycolatopsis saalfeldensis]|uniref:Uncharacterized protein n=1 Tax=Amycolatopsis saalfeldensis TaxID=394193 RepID=A0A1H8YM81_9PSEU|nr:hypothetical protein [Amycolatopsis saalfeldensis]SEP53290.1 hypothetical protein SAMN04489732_12613 [Amycolatopsis saalfeldensis]